MMVVVNDETSEAIRCMRDAIPDVSRHVSLNDYYVDQNNIVSRALVSFDDQLSRPVAMFCFVSAIRRGTPLRSNKRVITNFVKIL